MKKAIKFDHDKDRWDLLYWPGIENLVKVYTMGSRKYGDKNYLRKGGLDYKRVLAAVDRHLMSMRRNEWLDKESGLPHCAHAMWGLNTLMEYRDVYPKRRRKDKPKCFTPKKVSKVSK